MNYKLFFGLVHPRITSEMSNVKGDIVSLKTFIDHKKVINLLDVLENCRNDSKLFTNFELFIDELKGKELEKSIEIYRLYEKFYSGHKSNAFRVYLLKCEEEKIVDVTKSWRCFYLDDKKTKKRK